MDDTVRDVLGVQTLSMQPSALTDSINGGALRIYSKIA